MSKILLCLLIILAVSSSGFCGGSNNFGIGLLLGTSKSKILNINEIKQEYNADKKNGEDYKNYFINGFKQSLASQGIILDEQDIDITIGKDNPFSEKSDFTFDTGVILFDQYNFNDTFFVRVGAFGNFTVAKNTFSFIKEAMSIKFKDNQDWLANINYDLSLKHSFNVGGQLLVGCNIVKVLSFCNRW